MYIIEIQLLRTFKQQAKLRGEEKKKDVWAHTTHYTSTMMTIYSNSNAMTKSPFAVNFRTSGGSVRGGKGGVSCFDGGVRPSLKFDSRI